MTIGDSLLNHNTMTASSSCASSPPPAASSIAQQPQTQPLKCPRCDSANTKFCYYNNYSLSQPRHFCKACKRYWTRGGTLRNVPVGGGCRKNKRIKKAPAASASASAVAAASVSLPAPASSAATTSDHLNSLFFGQTSAPFPTLPPMYDLQPQLSALGIGFSSGNHQHDNGRFQLGFGPSLADLQQPGGFLNTYQLPGFDQELHADSSFDLQKQVKVEGENNVTGILDWQAQVQAHAHAPSEMMNQFDATKADSSYLYWSSPMVGGAVGWPDISNSSLAPLM